MSISAYRFRNEGALVVLQVMEESKRKMYDSYSTATWRDAKTEDLLDVARLVGPAPKSWQEVHREILDQ